MRMGEPCVSSAPRAGAARYSRSHVVSSTVLYSIYVHDWRDISSEHKNNDNAIVSFVNASVLSVVVKKTLKPYSTVR